MAIGSWLAGLVKGLHTARANGFALWLAVNHHLGSLYVDVPAALGVSHRVADVVAKLWTTTANLTLCHKTITSLRK